MVQMFANTSINPVMQKQLSGLANTCERTAEDEKKTNILANIPARNMASIHLEHAGKRIDGSGDWIINHSTYKEWKSGTGSLLWLCGPAGSGKTVLCSRIIDDLRSECTVNYDTAILYFYIDGSDREPLSINMLYSSLVYQLILQLPGVPRALDCHVRHRRSDDPMTNEELHELYQRLAVKLSMTYIVIDGLDECQDFIELEDMFQVFMDLLHPKMGRTNILASSRPLEQLRRRPFQNLDVLQISMEDDAAHVDIEMAVHRQLSGPLFRQWPQPLRHSVETKLLSKSRGSFHWVICQLGSLKRCMTPAAVQERLQNLPQTLDSHYMHELESLELNSGQSVRNVLRWVALSFRPLSIAELADAIAINVEDKDEPFFDIHLELFDIEAFLDSCSSLLTTYRIEDDTKNDETVFIKFAHFSVLEFLRSDILNNNIRAKLTLESGLVHSMLAKSCLVYITQFSADDTDDTASPLPSFIRYAASSWLRHKQLSHDKHWTLPSTKQMLQTMFDADSGSYNTWLKYSSTDRLWDYDHAPMDSSYTVRERTRMTRNESYTRPTPLYCAAFTGLTDVVRKLLDSGADPNVKCGIYAYALQAAAAYGHIDTVKHLVAAGARLDAYGGKCGCAIAAASTAGHTAIVRILLEAGAKIQEDLGLSDRHDDPLFMAAIGGHLDVVNLLLDYGAEDYHEVQSRPCTSLSAAIQTGRLDVVRAMLRHEHIRHTNETSVDGICVSHSSGLSQGLFYAASLGYKDILREFTSEWTDTKKLRYAARAGDEDMLSDAMARLPNCDEHYSGSDHPRALQSAAIGGHLLIVKKLLASGADPSLESDHSTAMNESVGGGNLDIARTLIEAGANVSSDWRVLRTAMSAGRRDFMELLVSHGADTYACLRSAVCSGEFGNFNVLLELGADIHRCDPDSDISLLQAAAFGGSVSIIRYLLDHGFGLEDITQTHPLTEAIRSGHFPVAKFLLYRGANVNAPPTSHQDPGSSWGGVFCIDNNNSWPPKAAYDTPLSAAIRAKNTDLVRQLLDMGALPDPRLPKTCGTPLLFAVWEEDFDIVHMLLEKGAPPNQPGSILRRKKPSYPILLAAEKGNLKILTALLAAGAFVNQQDAEGFSAAHVAAGCPNASCLRTLVCDYQADITLRLQTGSQPIHSAASRGDAEKLQILVDVGANINCQNDTGRTPLHSAADAENCETVELLLNLGADATATDHDGGMTAWDLMCLAAKKPWHSKRKQRGNEEKENQRAEKVRNLLREKMVMQEMNAKTMMEKHMVSDT